MRGTSSVWRWIELKNHANLASPVRVGAIADRIREVKLNTDEKYRKFIDISSYVESKSFGGQGELGYYGWCSLLFAFIFNSKFKARDHLPKLIQDTRLHVDEATYLLYTCPLEYNSLEIWFAHFFLYIYILKLQIKAPKIASIIIKNNL
jgi:hypothetical protein